MPKPELPSRPLPERTSSSQPVYGSEKPFSGSLPPPMGAWSHLSVSCQPEDADPLSRLEERLGLSSEESAREEGAREEGARRGRFATRAQPQADHRRSRGTFYSHSNNHAKRPTASPQTESPQQDAPQAEPLRARL